MSTNYAAALDLSGREAGFAVLDGGKVVLSLAMLIGRLELFTVLLLFTPGFWKKH